MTDNCMNTKDTRVTVILLRGYIVQKFILTQYTGWRRINWTIEPFKRDYKNLHKITLLKLLAHRQTRRQKRNVHFNILR